MVHPNTTARETTMLSNFHKNTLGTLTFDAKFPGMRKAQDFDVYPIGAGEAANVLTVQSSTRIGRICLVTGQVKMSPSFSGGTGFVHLAMAKLIATLDGEQLLQLKTQVAATMRGAAINQPVTVDNAGAIGALSVPA